MTPNEAAALCKKHGTIAKAARVSGIPRRTLSDWNSKAKKPFHRRGGRLSVSETSGKTPLATSEGTSQRRTARDSERIHPKKLKRVARPRSGVKRFLLTCAQNNTEIHHEFWRNLQAFAEHVGAQIHVARFTYALNGPSPHLKKSVKAQQREIEWAKELIPFLSEDRTEIAPGLVWCADLDILPTAVRPLSGLESYTGRASGVFPHPKIAMEPVASGKHEGTKHNYTTGTVTQRNYIQRKAGMKAEFHHCYGALMVEVDHTGTWFVRQINADSDGSFQDLDTWVAAGMVSDGHRVEAIYWGDGHDVESNEEAVALAFDEGGIKDQLRPRKDFIGDVISFKSRSHHDRKDPHRMFQRRLQGLGCVRSEAASSAGWFIRMMRDYCETHSVYGNHERHIGQWLKEADGRFDPVNAEFWSAMQSAVFAHIREHGEEPNFLETAIRIAYPNNAFQKRMRFLMEDESVVVCPDHGGGIECGMHGDRGPNGARGSVPGFAKSGRKTCIGHVHSSQIRDGVYVAGTFEKMSDNDWTRGQSSWSHSHVVIYPNGKRTIITCYKNKWRA